MSKSTKILIVEDQVLIADYINNLLSDEGINNIEIAYDIETAQKKIINFQPEIILLDINIEGKDSGIELAKNKNTLAKVIFITAQQDIATIQKAIATKPESYLTKPVKKADLLAAIQLANLKKEPEYISIKDGFQEIILTYNDILYIKSDGNYIDLFTSTKKISIRESLEKFYTKLDKEQFSRIHRSVIVNSKKISKKTASSVFIGSVELPLSRNYKKGL